MSDTPHYDGPPWRWIARDGVPARAVGGWRDGMPSFEHENNGFVVYDLLICATRAAGGMILTSPWYGTAVILAPDGLVPLHHVPTALWEWRPLLYNRTYEYGGMWKAMGSQLELGWRYGLADMQRSIADTEEWREEELAYRERELSPEELRQAAIDGLSQKKADDRADQLLHEHLNPQQLIEWVATDNGFLCRGGETGHTYRVRVGDGFERVHPVSHERLASYCLHPEYWIPHADVALATKLGLEHPETEHDLLDGANGHDWTALRAPLEDEQVAAKFERALIP